MKIMTGGGQRDKGGIWLFTLVDHGKSLDFILTAQETMNRIHCVYYVPRAKETDIMAWG